MEDLQVIQPAPSADLSPAEIERLSDEVRALAAERNAVILAHNYQLPEVQDVADHMGDSLGLSREAAATDADVIAFCGVHFMAETASILSPEKTVLIPDLEAGCSLSDSITVDDLRAGQRRAKPPRGDLDLGELGHEPKPREARQLDLKAVHSPGSRLAARSAGPANIGSSSGSPGRLEHRDAGSPGSPAEPSRRSVASRGRPALG